MTEQELKNWLLSMKTANGYKTFDYIEQLEKEIKELKKNG